MPRRKLYAPPLCECKGCYYWRQMCPPYNGCHYRLDTFKIRGIPPIECYKHEGTPYKPMRKGRNNVPESHG